MNKNTPRKEIVRAISKGARLSLPQAEEVLQSITEVMKQELLKGGAVTLTGLCRVYYHQASASYVSSPSHVKSAGTLILKQFQPEIRTGRVLYKRVRIDE